MDPVIPLPLEHLRNHPLSDVNHNDRTQFILERQLNKELQQAIKSTKRTNADLRGELKILRQTVNHQNDPEHLIGKPTRSTFLSKFPLEVREEIYKHLLVNPALEEFEPLGWETEFGATHQYGLTPGILGTCRQIYHEAVPLLYKWNTFAMVFAKSLAPKSAITRYRVEDKSVVEDHRDYQIPGIKHVRNWKFLTAGCVAKFGKTPTSPPKSFTDFCRVICLDPPQSLEVLVIMSEPKSHWLEDENVDIELEYWDK